jgi:hypothetical protein
MNPGQGFFEADAVAVAHCGSTVETVRLSIPLTSFVPFDFIYHVIMFFP